MPQHIHASVIIHCDCVYIKLITRLKQQIQRARRFRGKYFFIHLLRPNLCVIITYHGGRDARRSPGNYFGDGMETAGKGIIIFPTIITISILIIARFG
jgi:hypothetical protein